MMAVAGFEGVCEGKMVALTLTIGLDGGPPTRQRTNR